MRVLSRLRLWLRPLTLLDPIFGKLTFISIESSESRSYWEAEWFFPPTGTTIHISLPGSIDGPSQEARDFYGGLPSRFPKIMTQALPRVESAFAAWYKRPVASPIWQDLKLSGFDLDDATPGAPRFSIMFEATGRKWLAISVPFLRNEAQNPVVDT